MKQAKKNPLLRRRAERLSLAIESRSQDPAIPKPAQLRRWAAAALQAGVQQAEISLLIVGEEEGRMLNRDYRGKDYATNVLSFALNEGEPIPGLPPKENYLAGDIVFAAPVVAREAAEQSITLEAHYAHLTVHGMLHLQGYDHEDEHEAVIMEALETAILARLGYSDPYAAEKN